MTATNVRQDYLVLPYIATSERKAEMFADAIEALGMEYFPVKTKIFADGENWHVAITEGMECFTNPINEARIEAVFILLITFDLIEGGSDSMEPLAEFTKDIPAAYASLTRRAHRQFRVEEKLDAILIALVGTNGAASLMQPQANKYIVKLGGGQVMTSIVSSLLRGSVHDDEHGATITIRPAGGCATVKHFAIHADDEYIGTVSRYEDGSGWRASMSSKGFFPSIAFGNTMDESICNAIAEAKAKSLAHKRAVDRLESLLFRLDHTGQTSSRQPSAKTVVTRQRQMRIVPAVAP